MNIANIFKRMFNKSAKSRPAFARDYTSAPSIFQSADRTATTFACMDRIASEFAALNFAIYDKRTRAKTARHSLQAVLTEPNREERRRTFFYQSAIDYLNGGCYWLKIFVDGAVASLVRLERGGIVIYRDEKTNERKFAYNGVIYTNNDIVFIPSRFEYNTLRGGVSVFDAARGAFETAAEVEKFTRSSFANGILGKRVVIDYEKSRKQFTDEQLEATRNNFVNVYSGVENAGKPIMQGNGVEYKELGDKTDNAAAELIDNRRFQEHEIAKIFGIPEQLLGGMGSKDAAGSIEDAFLLFNEFAIRPMAQAFEDAVNSMLDESRYYFEFDYNGVLKVSFEKRIDAYIKQITNGLLSPNEARQKENMDAIEAGDNHFMPANLMPLNEETIKAYMAKQKNEIAQGKDGFGQGEVNPADPDAQHSLAGDDKQ